MRDGKAISHGFRLPEDADTVTVKVKPTSTGLVASGVILTSFLLLPIGIPLWIAGRPRVWIANGAPSEQQEFVRLRKAS